MSPTAATPRQAGAPRPGARRPPEPPREQAGRPCKIAVKDLTFFYGDEARAREHLHRHPGEPGHRLHRSVGLRQEHVPAHAEPHERHRPRRRASRADVQIDGQDIYHGEMDVVALRRRVGMVFQRSNPFPKSIFENIAYGLRINGMADEPGASCRSGSKRA